jgi:DNA invertase Pin-like site-specific DNA recombinase
MDEMPKPIGGVRGSTSSKGDFIGYARVSTGGQDLAPQLDALRAAGCARIVEERASGGDRDRPELARLLGSLQAGDTLVVARIDRLARSLGHLLEVLERLRAAGVAFRSLDDPIDTSGPSGTLVLQILGAVAEFERSLIRERTRAGVAAARQRGRVPGNPRLRAGDPEAIRRIRDARAEAYLDSLIATASDWLPAVRELRADHRTWSEVARVLNVRVAAGRGGADPGGWTPDRLQRAVRRLVSEGLAERELLAPRRRARSRRDDERVLRMVATMATQTPRPTLGAIAAHLERLGERTPRGSTRWATSSVAVLIERARARKLTRTGPSHANTLCQASPVS